MFKKESLLKMKVDLDSMVEGGRLLERLLELTVKAHYIYYPITGLSGLIQYLLRILS